MLLPKLAVFPFGQRTVIVDLLHQGLAPFEDDQHSGR